MGRHPGHCPGPTNYFAQNWKNFLKGRDESESSRQKLIWATSFKFPDHRETFLVSFVRKIIFFLNSAWYQQGNCFDETRFQNFGFYSLFARGWLRSCRAFFGHHPSSHRPSPRSWVSLLREPKLRARETILRHNAQTLIVATWPFKKWAVVNKLSVCQKCGNFKRTVLSSLPKCNIFTGNKPWIHELWDVKL